MAQNVTVAGASYTGVPSVVLPKTGGGSATFLDTTIGSNAAAASDIASGKLAYVNGSLIEGTGTGGGGSYTTETLADGGTHYIITTSGGGGGATYSSGTYTPDSNTLTASFNIGSSSYNHFLIWATSNPYGNGVRTAALGFVDFANNRQYVISSNSAGSSSAANIQWTYSATAFCFSKNGTTVTLSSSGTNAAHFNYLISGITYNWIAW